MAHRKHVPQRTCVICRRTFAKRDLTRIVRTPETGVRIDATGKQAGRGAYVCSDPDCWRKVAHSDALDRALKTQLTAEERVSIAAHGAQNAPPTEN